MIRGLAALLACQLVGEAAAHALGLPVPGPVLGLGLLVAGLALWQRLTNSSPAAMESSEVGRVADGLLSILAFLFVPAGVGVVQHLGLIGTYGLALGLALVVSTLATMVATVGVFLLVKRLTGGTDATADGRR